MKAIEIFRAGTHRAMNGADVTITAADLSQLAAAYDPARYEAPIVVGHPETNHPAYGWVGGLTVDGDKLVATPTQLDPAFAVMVEAGRFKKRSSSFFRPADPHNPTPGKWALRHVGFLGAAPPAVAGLKEVSFGAGDNAVEFADWQGLSIARLFGQMRDFFIAQFGLEKADAVLPADAIDQLRFEAAQPAVDPAGPTETSDFGVDMTETEKKALADQTKALADEKAALERQQVAFAAAQKADRVKGITAFVDGLIAAGKLPTGNKEPLIAFMATIPAGDAGTFEFAQADGTKKPADALDWFKGFLGGIQKLVPTGEFARHREGENFAQGHAPAIDPGKIYALHNAPAK